MLDDPYPYHYEIVPTMLAGAAHEGVVELPGATCFRLSVGGQPIYLLWSDAGEQTADLSVELRGQVQVTDATGSKSTQDAEALRVTEAPMFVEP